MPKLKQRIVKYGQPCPGCGLSWAHGSVLCNYPYSSGPIKQTGNLREQFNKLVEKETTLCGDEVEVVWSFIQKALTLEHDRAIEKINKELQTVNQNTVAYEQGKKDGGVNKLKKEMQFNYGCRACMDNKRIFEIIENMGYGKKGEKHPVTKELYDLSHKEGKE